MTRRPIPALVTALGVLAFLIAKDLVSAVVSWIGTAGLAAASPLDYLGWFGLGLLSPIAIAAGVFLVLWLVLPVTARSSTAATIAAGVLAAVGGAIASRLSNVVVTLATARSQSGSLYDIVPLDLAPGWMISQAVLLTVSLLPLTVLAAILLREWSRSKGRVSAEATPVDAV